MHTEHRTGGATPGETAHHCPTYCNLAGADIATGSEPAVLALFSFPLYERCISSEFEACSPRFFLSRLSFPRLDLCSSLLI